jgi:hypothetical protein
MTPRQFHLAKSDYEAPWKPLRLPGTGASTILLDLGCCGPSVIASTGDYCQQALDLAHAMRRPGGH